MLKFTYREQILVRVHASCPAHPRYNPEIGGENKIKGGCVKCRALFEVWEAKRKVETALRALQIVAEPFRPAKRKAASKEGV